ncbi:hypothetical protein MNBD_UNCLBAC01-14 [hydrothermal vent metagenome]|uniref:Metal-dependent phosphoesterases (PHP family) n=1 Tax=hydrothermal vent metagenome TaxID=652676 RepID=A0A3B1DJU4_9ZZZZ
MQNVRTQRMALMIEKLKNLGVDNIELEEVCTLAKSKAVGRPHLATVLKEKGWVPNLKAAFNKYLANDAPAYVSKFQQTPKEAFELIHSLGGVAVLAHPMLTKADPLIPQFVREGLDGLEACYPNTPDTIKSFYEGLAKKHGILVTGGSDAHGDAKKHTWVGKVQVHYNLVEALKERARC